MRNKITIASPPSKEAKQQARINPEFLGIGKQFVQSHYQRKNIQLNEKHVSNRVSFLQKQQEMAERMLQKKQNELNILMEIIARKEADDDYKERVKQEKQMALAQLRQQNMRRRHQHQQKLRNAYLSLYDENRNASQIMRKTVSKYQSMRQSMKADEIQNKKQRYLSISFEKKEGRKKVDSYHKSRNDIFTSNYKSKINQEKTVASKANAHIQNLNSIQNQLKLKLQTSSSKINQIQQRYRQVYQCRLKSNKSLLSSNNSSQMKNSRGLPTKIKGRFEGRQYELTESQVYQNEKDQKTQYP